MNKYIDEDESLERLAKSFGWNEVNSDQDVPGEICSDVTDSLSLIDHQKAIDDYLVWSIALSDSDEGQSELLEQVKKKILEHQKALRQDILEGWETPISAGLPGLSQWVSEKPCSHEWVDTGFKKSWCKHCNKDHTHE